jgi:hypothetical protein
MKRLRRDETKVEDLNPEIELEFWDKKAFLETKDSNQIIAKKKTEFAKLKARRTIELQSEGQRRELDGDNRAS